MNVPEAYAANRGLDQDEVVKRYAPLVKRIAYHLAGRLPPSIQVEDLIQAGMIGLLDAARNFDETHGASFTTYASTRVRGAMWDEVRRSDWTPRSVNRKARQAAEAIRNIENREGRDARDTEVAEALGIGLDEYNQILTDALGSKLLSLEDPELLCGESSTRANTSGSAPGPLQQLETQRFRQGLVEAIATLPTREQLVMSLYYDDELNLREIGSILDVSESRVCQIHGQAMLRLRARLQDWLDST